MNRRSPASCLAPDKQRTPTTIVSGLKSGFGVAVDTTSVYWSDASTGVIGKADKDGGSATTLAVAPGAPEAIAIDDGFVYVQAGSGIGRVAKSGGDAYALIATPYSSLHSAGVFADGTNVYFAGDQSDTSVFVRVKPDGTELANLVSADSRLYATTTNETDALYWLLPSFDPKMATLYSVPKTGGTPTLRLQGRSCGTAIANAMFVFCGGDYKGPYRVGASALAVDLCPEWDPLLVPVDVVLVGSFLFVLIDDGSILRVSTTGSGALYATGFSAPRRMATDGTTLFVTGLNSVQKVAIE